MSKLRKVDGVYYDLALPENLGTVKYRSMKVKETRNLLTAIEMRDEVAVVNTILDIIEAATRASFDVRSLPMHIIDLIFLRIYSKSSGNRSNGSYICAGTTTTDEGEETTCGKAVNIEIDLDKADLIYPDGYKTRESLSVGDGQIIVLRIPSLDNFKRLKTDADTITQFIYSGVESITDGDNVYVPGQDFTVDDLNDWLNDLEASSLDKINAFFRETPKLGLDIKATCPHCGKKEEFEIRGLEDFFV